MSFRTPIRMSLISPSPPPPPIIASSFLHSIILQHHSSDRNDDKDDEEREQRARQSQGGRERCGAGQEQRVINSHVARSLSQSLDACFFVCSGALKASFGYLARPASWTIPPHRERPWTRYEAPEGHEGHTRAAVQGGPRRRARSTSTSSGTEDDHNFNKGCLHSVISPIDGRSMESITSVKVFHGSEVKSNGKVIRWTEVFFLQSEDHPGALGDPADHSRLTENVARAFCTALGPHLKLLKEDGMAKLGLRVTLDTDQVGYLAGSNGQPLLPQYLGHLDSTLIPVIHGGACQLSEGPVVMELVFYILEIIS
ncbi:unnamed protein product [Arctogadus glacialis]